MLFFFPLHPEHKAQEQLNKQLLKKIKNKQLLMSWFLGETAALWPEKEGFLSSFLFTYKIKKFPLEVDHS